MRNYRECWKAEEEIQNILRCGLVPLVNVIVDSGEVWYSVGYLPLRSCKW